MSGRRSNEPLEESLALFDGKHTDLLERIATEHALDAALVDLLIALAAGPNPTVAAAAVWMLRRADRHGFRFSAAHSRGIVRLLLAQPPWPCMLDLLQMLGSLAIAPAQVEPLLQLLYRTAEHDNTFVRAWSFNALLSLGSGLDAHAARIERLVAKAEASDKASVRARIRLARAELAKPTRRMPQVRRL